MRVLLAEDDDFVAEIMANALGEFGYEVTIADNGRKAFDLVRTGEFRLVVSDWEMPEMSGIDLCRHIRCRQWSGYIYVILLTSHGGVHNVVQGLQAGADDFLTKPFEPQELQLRLNVGERVLSLESRDLMIFALAKLAESRDEQTGAHLERMREYCRVLAAELCEQDERHENIDGEFVQLIYLTSPLHDIGKVGIPDRVLLKPGRLTPEEFDVMKRHTLIGGETLEAAARNHPDALFLTIAREIALTHHEWFDGSGYPYGLAGKQIPLSGRITMLADVYDALTSRRVYKPAYSHKTARELILKGCGKQFDPDIVEIFLRREEEFREICEHQEHLEADSQNKELAVEPAAEPAAV